MEEIAYTTIEEGTEKLREHVKLRNSMGGVLYWSIVNDQCMSLGEKLIRDGADEKLIAEIGDWILK